MRWLGMTIGIIGKFNFSAVVNDVRVCGESEDEAESVGQRTVTC